MKIKKKNKVLIILIALVIITIGVSYALWTITKEQTGENIVNTSCLDIELTNEEDSISLTNAFPITDAEGKVLKPYKFTIHNKCDNYVDYNINLEMLSETSLSSENIKVLLNKVETDTNPKLLNDYPQNEVPKISEAKESRQLTVGRLRKLESVNYELRLWLKEELTKESGIENQIAKSKIFIEGKVGEQVASDYIEELAKTDETNLAYDNTKDNNLRYIGNDPNNYVDIGDRDTEGQPILWRIIGVMNNITSLDDVEKQESLIKIIRADSIGIYSWDSSELAVNNGYGVNEWSQADLMKLLNPGYDDNMDTNNVGEKIKANNSLFWNQKDGECFVWKNNENKKCDFTSNGLSDKAKSFISKVKWNLGTPIENKITASYMYDGERSINKSRKCEYGIYCNDDIERTTRWDGYVALIYPSDFGYAVGGEARNNCLLKDIDEYDNECNKNNWLRISSTYNWTLTPLYSSALDVYHQFQTQIITHGVLNGYDVKPTAYLKSNVKILENPNNEVEYGSKLNPFQLEI